MNKDLTTSRIDRQNILNNEMAIEEIQDKSGIEGINWEGKIYLTRKAVAAFFEVDIATISRYIEQYNEELTENGYVVLQGQELNSFLSAAPDFTKDIDDPGNICQLGLFDFRAFLNLAMLLSESEKARALRLLMLDIVIDLINSPTGGGTKYLDQQDKDCLGSALQEVNHRRQFTDALKRYVTEDRYKYGHFTEMIYASFFQEKAHLYKKILDLKASDAVRDTFYSEILDIIAEYERGLADAIKQEYEALEHVLSIEETEALFHRFESMDLWEPLIHQARAKMTSCDAALREEFHYQLSEYIQPNDEDEYQKFLSVAGDEFERLMADNHEALKRLKERE